MDSVSPEISKAIEHSSKCMARAKRVSEKAARLRETSQRLQEESAALLRYNRGRGSLVGNLRLPKEPRV